MVFSSSIFLFVFLPLTLFVYYVINDKLKNTWLLFVSLSFYFWGEQMYTIVMLASITINYVFGLIIHWVNSKKRPILLGRIAIGLAVFANLSLLFWFKYLDFGITTANSLFGAHIPLQHVILPIGISFFTFQGMTYVIDLYWGNTTVQKNPFKVALYISLFPQLIAGPIVRYKDVAAQIDQRKVDMNDFAAGTRRFVIGLGKKVIIANTVALTADNIFNAPFAEHTMATAWLGIICYSIQIYFDFSGYSDMAIGLGRMFGFHFLENFNYPYISTSITEFWRRWHISLSSFFRDYLYIPLGGNRRGFLYLNLFIVFFATGLWHGASWNFVVWGFWHGAFIIIERLLKNSEWAKRIVVPTVIKRAYLLLVVMIGWVFFRAENLAYALGYLRIMFGLQQAENVGFTLGYYLDTYLAVAILLGIVGSVPFIVQDDIKKMGRTAYSFFTVARTCYILLVLFVSAVFVFSSTYNPFIYFRF